MKRQMRSSTTVSCCSQCVEPGRTHTVCIHSASESACNLASLPPWAGERSEVVFVVHGDGVVCVELLVALRCGAFQALHREQQLLVLCSEERGVARQIAAVRGARTASSVGFCLRLPRALDSAALAAAPLLFVVLLKEGKKISYDIATCYDLDETVEE